jgi:hypothetical protein
MNGQAAGKAGDGWRAAVPEIIIAAIVIVVAAVAGYAAAGLAGTAVVATCAAVTSLVVLRVLTPAPTAHGDGRVDDTEAIPVTFTGYWRNRAGLVDGTQSMTAFDAELRGTLQRLLAARLAEHHGISLHDDPDGARRLLCPTPRDDPLWYWVDPARPPATAGKQSGIPPRTLARLIHRLEQL